MKQTTRKNDVIFKGKIWDFPGGIHPEQHKTISNQTPIKTIPCPKKVYLPIIDYKGGEANSLVQVGQRVSKGEAVIESKDMPYQAIHSPIDGVVEAIELRDTLLTSRLKHPTLIIASDNTQSTRFGKAQQSLPATLSREYILEKIRTSGILGLGGALFPTYTKLSTDKNIKTLIINAVECEPYITCDDRLTREKSDEIVVGIEILQKVLHAEQILFAIEDNKPEASEAIKQSIAKSSLTNTQVVVVPTKYPSGGERQLIQILTGTEVPAGTFPSELHILVQNVGTIYAIKRTIIDGEPCISRIITITGNAVSSPGNYEIPIGTPIHEALKIAGLQKERLAQLIVGGPMMGIALPHTHIGIDKSTNCIIASEHGELNDPANALPCIRCGQCAGVCPASLLPQQLYWFSKSKNLAKLEEYHLSDCIECGACAYVCPSEIPLVNYFRFGKSETRLKALEKQKSDNAKQRYDFRQMRLEREKLERAQRHKKAAEERRKRAEKSGATDDKKQAIMEALARVNAKKQESSKDNDS